MPESLTIIGASARAAAQSARRASFAPIAGDLFADVDLRETCPATRVSNYPFGLEQVLHGEQSGGWMYTGALENFTDLIERWSAIRPLYGNGASVLRRVRDPRQVAECLRRANLRCPAIAMTGEDVPRDGSWLRKPLSSAGGYRVVRFTHNNASEDRPVYYQQFVSGVPCSAVYVGAAGKATLLGITRQLLDGDSFRYAGSVGPMAVDDAARLQFEAIGIALAREFLLVGLFGVDAVLSKDEVWPVEVNPRYPASVEVLERSSETSAVGLHVVAWRDGALPKSLPAATSRVIAKAIYFAEEDFTVQVDLRQVIDGIADVPHVGAQIRKHAPVATVLRSGRDEAEVERALSVAIDQLRANTASNTQRVPGR